jgi:hypothetical protein
VPTAGIVEARNNRGSNVLVPYARLVPMQGRENRHNPDPNDKRVVYVNGKAALEYDGLRTGEVAWILGRRFKGVSGGAGGDATTNSIEELTSSQRYSHQAYIGLGNGVDRMQRVASTDWVEALVEDKLGQSRIDLHSLKLDSPYSKAMSDEVANFGKYLVGATAMVVPDLTWWHAQVTQDRDTFPAVGYNPNLAAGLNSGRKLQGISVLETGPFLRGIQVDDTVVRFKKEVQGGLPAVDLPRNLGDNMAFTVLEAEIRRRNLMDWSPDGVVLSKLESPTDDPMKSTEMDARSAQLFNIGVQGPAVTTAWTGRGHQLQVQPMDKVFICLVATLAYTVNTLANDEYAVLKRKQGALLTALTKYERARQERKPLGMASAVVEDAIKDVQDARDEYLKAIGASAPPRFMTLDADLKALRAQAKTMADSAGASEKDKKDAQTDLDTVQRAFDSFLLEPSQLTALDTKKIMARQQAMREGKTAPTKAILTNFKLMRSTSSHFANYSYPRSGAVDSRLGLKISKPNGSPVAYDGAAEFIVGAWCIGTVLDSAASRSTVGNLVRTAPTSLAVSVNVNVQWWSGDRLYKAYHDKGGNVLMRGESETELPGGSKRVFQEVDEDANAAPIIVTVQDGNSFDREPDGPFGPPRVPVASTADPHSAEAATVDPKRQRADSGAGIGGARPASSRRA